MNFKSFILYLTTTCISLSTSTAWASIDQTINEWTSPLAIALKNFVFYKINLFGSAIPLVVIWLVAGALFFTFYLNWVNLRAFKHAIELIRGDYEDPNSEGEVSHFQESA